MTNSTDWCFPMPVLLEWPPNTHAHAHTLLTSSYPHTSKRLAGVYLYMHMYQYAWIYQATYFIVQDSKNEGLHDIRETTICFPEKPVREDECVSPTVKDHFPSHLPRSCWRKEFPPLHRQWDYVIDSEMLLQQLCIYSSFTCCHLVRANCYYRKCPKHTMDAFQSALIPLCLIFLYAKRFTASNMYCLFQSEIK